MAFLDRIRRAILIDPNGGLNRPARQKRQILAQTDRSRSVQLPASSPVVPQQRIRTFDDDLVAPVGVYGYYATQRMLIESGLGAHTPTSTPTPAQERDDAWDAPRCTPVPERVLPAVTVQCGRGSDSTDSRDEDSDSTTDSTDSGSTDSTDSSSTD